jgi:hypothetical protein
MNITVKIDKSGFKGEAIIDVRPFTERAQMLKDLDIDVKDGEAKISDQMDKVVKIQQMVKKHTQKINVRYEDETDFSSFDELECYAEGQEVINILAGYVLNGVKLSKN